MDVEKLIEDLRGLLKQYGEKIPYGELVGAPWPYSRAGDLVWQDPEPYFIEQAASALSTLQAENEKLKDQLYDGEGVNLVNYWMQQAKIEENGHRNCQAENEKLRNEVERQRRSADDRKHLYENAERAYMKVVAELEQVKRDLDAAVKDMEALMWFSGEGCHICAHEIVIHKEPYVRSECALGNGAACCPTWRGRKEE